MKKPVHRKKKETPVISPEILEAAKNSLRTDTAKSPSVKCSVCNAEVAQFADEPLCWVCRRLKISAWADRENTMMPMGDQE